MDHVETVEIAGWTVALNFNGTFTLVEDPNSDPLTDAERAEATRAVQTELDIQDAMGDSPVYSDDRLTFSRLARFIPPGEGALH